MALRPKGAFQYTRKRRGAAAAATHLNIYGSNSEIIIPYIVMYVAAAAAARSCRVYGNAPLKPVQVCLVDRLSLWEESVQVFIPK